MTPTGLGTITRRTALGGLSAAAAGLLLFGPRATDDIPPGRKVLDYWEKWTGAEGAAMRALVDEFNATQDRLYIRYLSIGAIDEKAMIAIAGGAPPDIIGLWNFNVPSYAEAGALAPMDELAASHGIDRRDYADAVWPLLTHQDQLWSMISTCGSLALYLNLDAIESAGIDPKKAPETIAELDELNEAYMSRRADGSIERMGFVHTDPGWWSWLWGYHFGGALLDPRTGNATVDAPENQRAYEWVASYPERFGSDQLLAFQSGLGFYGNARTPFLTGQVASTIQGPWIANLIKAFQPNLRYKAVPMPVEARIHDAARPVGLLDGDVLVIPKGAKDPEASFEFIAWLQQPKRLESLASSHGKNSPLRASSPEFIAGHTNSSIGVHNEIAGSDRAFAFPRTRVWPRCVAEFDAGFQSLWLGERSAPGMLAGVQEVMQREIMTALQKQARRRAAES